MAQVLIVKKNGKPYFVGLVAEVSNTEYLELVKKCEEAHKQEEKEKAALVERLAKAENKINKLKHEIAIDRGEVEQ